MENSATPRKRNAVDPTAFSIVRLRFAKARKPAQKSHSSIRNPLLYPAELRAQREKHIARFTAKKSLCK